MALRIWIQPSAKEVSEREVRRARKEYAEQFGEIGLEGVSIGAAFEPSSCFNCGAQVWAANNAYRSTCDRCKKKVGF